MDTTQDITTEQLPTWMRQARQSVDWGILLVGFFSLLMAWPFLLQPGVPQTTNAENHVYMASDYAQAFREGRIYPRWSAAAAQGYGAPIPNYYPPGLPYVTATTEVLLTPQDTVLAMRLVMLASVMTAGFASYVFVMRFAGAYAGVIAALLYVYSPYLGLTAPHLEGNYPVVMAAALLPLLLWAVSRMMARAHPLDFAVSTLSSAGLILTHPPGAAAGGLLVLMVMAWHALRELDVRRLLLTVSAVVLGVALSAFYWLPALVEADSVRWVAQDVPAAVAVLRFPDVLLPPAPVDLNELVPAPRLTVGLPVLVIVPLGLLGLLRGWRYVPGRNTLIRLNIWLRGRDGLHGLFGVAGALILVVGLWLMPESIWLLIPAALSFAAAGSAAVHLHSLLPESWQRLPMPVLTLLVVALSAGVWLAPRWERDVGPVDQAAQVAYQQQGYGTAVLPADDPVPLTMPAPVVPNRALIESYQDGRVVRVPNLRTAGNKQASLIESGSHHDRYQVSTGEPVVFDVLRAYDPGWRATLDGAPVRIAENAANGLMQVNVPETRGSSLEITLGATPLRRQSWLLSGVALLVMLLSTGYALLRVESKPTSDLVRYINVQDARLMLFICIGFLAVLLTAVVPRAPLSLYPRPGGALDGFTELRASTDVGIEALAYRPPSEVADYHVGDTIDVTLAWRALQPLRENYRVRAYLHGEPGDAPRAIVDRAAPGHYPTRRWPTNRFVRDTYKLSLAGALPGRYRIVVQLYACGTDCSTEERVTFFNQDGTPVGETFLLPRAVRVRP